LIKHQQWNKTKYCYPPPGITCGRVLFYTASRCTLWVCPWILRTLKQSAGGFAMFHATDFLSITTIMRFRNYL